MDKTIVVVSETRVPHPTYGKIVRKSTRFKAHDEPTSRHRRRRSHHGVPPVSRDKRWRLVEIVERAK